MTPQEPCCWDDLCFITRQVHLSPIRGRQSTWSIMVTRPVSQTWTVTWNPSSSCGEDARRAARHPSLSTLWAGSKVSSGERSWEVNPPTGVWTSVLSLAVLRIWIPAARGHDSLLTGVARCPARSRRRHPLSRSHPRVSQNSARLPDAPTRPDSPGRVHREPHPPEKLHSPHCAVGVPGSRPSRNSVSLPLEFVSWRCSMMLYMLWCLVDRRHQRSNEMRELSLLAYLSQMQSADLGPVRPLHSLVPYQVYDIHQANYVVILHTKKWQKWTFFCNFFCFDFKLWLFLCSATVVTNLQNYSVLLRLSKA